MDPLDSEVPVLPVIGPRHAVLPWLVYAVLHVLRVTYCPGRDGFTSRSSVRSTTKVTTDVLVGNSGQQMIGQLIRFFH